MAIPRSFEMYPVIMRCVSDEQLHSLNDIRTRCAEMLGLTEKELSVRTPGGYRSLYSDRMGRAVNILRDAGLLSSPGRGFYRMTELGDEAFDQGPENIDVTFINNLKKSH